jgi:peptide/nickel transport system substrate-binding protein
MSRRDLRRFLYTALSSVTAFLVACQSVPSPSTPSGGTTGGAAPATVAPAGPSGKLVVGDSAPIITIYDPGLANDSGTLRFFFPAFDGLTWLDTKGQSRPGLAKEWKAPSSTVWEFTLGDYKFQNGRAVTVDDVIGTFERYRDPAKKLRAATVFAAVDKIEAIPPNGVRITLKSPDPTFPAILSTAMIMPMQEVNQQGEEAFFKKPIGSGPFKVEQADFPNGLKFSAMGADFPTSRSVPNIKDLEIRFIPDTTARIAGLRTGDLDVALRIPGDQAATVDAAGLKVFRDLQERAVSFLLDPTNGPTKDVRVRQAINYAVDKDTILKAYYLGNGSVDGQLLAPYVLGYNPDVKPYPFDQAKAKALLAEAGYPNGFETKYTCTNTTSSPQALCVIIADQLKQVGITGEIQVLDIASWANDFFAGRERRPGIWAQAVNWDQTFEANAIWRWYSSDIAVTGGRRYDDEEFDKLYQAAKATIDPVQRAAAYQKAGVRLHDTAPVLFGWQDTDTHASKKDVTFFTKSWFADFYTGVKRG